MNHLTDFQLNEYLDDAIDETMKHKFDSHLRACADCSARLDELNFLFASLVALPEIKLRRDLSPAILARLSQKQPRLWTPSFAAQLGAALGILFWLSTQLANLIPSNISSLHFPQIPESNFQFPNLYSLLTTLRSPFSAHYSPFSIFNLSTFNHQLFNFPTFQLSIFSFQLSNLPTFQPSNLTTFQPSTLNIILISVCIFTLWMFGNYFLLRNRSGVQK